MFRTSNPAMRAFEKPQRWEDLGGTATQGLGKRAGGEAGSRVGSGSESGAMTYGGVAQVTGLLLGIVLLSGMASWLLFDRGIVPMGMSMPILLGGIAVSVIATLVVSFKPGLAKVIGPVVSVSSGFFAGAVSFFVATQLGARLEDSPGLVGGSSEMSRQALTERGAFVVLQAVLLTVGVVVAMLVAVATGLIKVRGKFARVVMGLTGALMFVYLINIGMRMFGMSMPFIHSTGPAGIAFSGVTVVLASLNLAMDFTMIEDSVKGGQPKKMEWFAGFALVTTIVWLYIEILHLLYKLYAMFGQE